MEKEASLKSNIRPLGQNSLIDKDDWRQERGRFLLLSIRILAVLGTLLISLAVFVNIESIDQSNFIQANLWLWVVGLVIIWGLMLFHQAISYKFQLYTILTLLWIFSVRNLLVSSYFGPGRLTLLLFVFFASTFSRLRLGFITFIISGITLAIVGILTRNGFFFPDYGVQSALISGNAWAITSFRLFFWLLIITLVSYRIILNAQNRLESERKLTDRLANERETIEKLINERTQTLQLAGAINRSLSDFSDAGTLSQSVVTQIQEAFDYYHVQLYLFDDQKKMLLLAGSTGEAGRALLAARHRIQAGIGLTGQVALLKKTLNIPHVRQDGRWRSNPILPDTQSELVIPIIFSSDVLGVIDIQHHQPNGLSVEEVALMESIGNQIGITLHNLSLFEATRRRTEREAFIQDFSRNMRSMTDTDAILQYTIRSLGKVVPASTIKVALETAVIVNPQSGESINNG